MNYMLKHLKLSLCFKIILICILTIPGPVYAHNKDGKQLKFDHPILLTSIGNSETLKIVNSIFEKIEIHNDWLSFPDKEVVQGGSGLPEFKPYRLSTYGPISEMGVNTNCLQGTPYKTIVVIMDIALGLGSIDTEYKMINNLIDTVEWANSAEIKIVGMHLQGKIGRGKVGSVNEYIWETLSSQCDLLMVTNSSNYDGKFNEMGDKFNIPVLAFDDVNSMIPILNELFNK